MVEESQHVGTCKDHTRALTRAHTHATNNKYVKKIKAQAFPLSEPYLVFSRVK